MRNKRMYSLFDVAVKSDGRKQYTQIGLLSFPKPIAVRYYQNALLNAFCTGKHVELRPIKESECGI